MFTLHPANQRGHTQTGWLNSYHSFSFGEYYDADNIRFSELRVINDDILAPDMGFGMHPHANMEIMSIILSGKLEHKDSLGNGTFLKTGDIQKTSAGTGIYHSEFNPSPNEIVHFLQIWIFPNMKNIKPSSEKKTFSPQTMSNQLCYIATPDGRDDSFIIQQDAEIFQCLLEANINIVYKLEPKRKYWLQMASGNIELNGQVLIVGDGMAIENEDSLLELKGINKQSNFLLFNLPTGKAN